MSKTIMIAVLTAVVGIFAYPWASGAQEETVTFRKSTLSNEFDIKTPEGINARGVATVTSTPSGHKVKIKVDGLTPGATFAILNHWFEPIPERGISSLIDKTADPSCNGHFQFLGEPVEANKKGKIKTVVQVNQLAPHIWVVNFAKFLEVTNEGNQAPASADAFITGGLLIPFADIHTEAAEENFEDTEPLTVCE